MAGLGDLVNLDGFSIDGIANGILDFTFGSNAIWLRDVGEILGAGVNFPVPLVGFEYELPDIVPLLDFSYSEYPYADRTAIINAYVKNNTRQTIIAHRPITPNNKFIINYALNEALYKILDEYISRSGRFTILTPWCSLGNYLCEKWSGIKKNDSDVGGQTFKFEFVRANIPSDAVQKQQNSYLSSITGGGAM